MKKYISIIIIVFAFISCERTVDVNLNTAPPKLVIDASLKWIKGTTGNNQEIKLSLTGDFFTNATPPANGAIVTVTNSSNTVFNFVEDGNTGVYKCTNFVPVINENYTLNVSYQGQIYNATDKLFGVPDITTINQQNGGVTGNEIELKFNFLDNGSEANFYLEEYKVPFRPFPLYSVFDDEFTNGNINFGLIIEEDFSAGQNINFKLHSISERYFNYMSILIGVSGGNSNGPFTTPPASVRGNIINVSNSNNFPFGYFRLSEIAERNYVIQ